MESYSRERERIFFNDKQHISKRVTEIEMRLERAFCSSDKNSISTATRTFDTLQRYKVAS